MMTVLLGLLAAMLLGGALAWLGWRGRRINNHPTCRQCRFDLSGTPTPLVTCPECGCGLIQPGAIAIGERRRRPTLVVGGMVLGLVAAAVLTALAFAVATGVDLNRHKPVAFLVWEAEGSMSKERRDRSALEVLRRAAAGEMSPRDWRGAIDAALSMQADASRPWSEQWGNIYERARVLGVSTADDEARFLRQSAEVEWKVRPKVRAGDPIPIIGQLRSSRIGTMTELHIDVYLDSAVLHPRSRDGQARELGFRGSIHIGGIFPEFRSYVGRSPINILLPTSELRRSGSKEIRLEATVVPRRNPDDRGRGLPEENDPHAIRQSFVAPVDIVDSPTVNTIPAASDQRRSLETALRFAKAREYPRQTAGDIHSAEGRTLIVSIPRLPRDIPYAFTVAVQVGDRRIAFARVTSGLLADESGSSSGFSLPRLSDDYFVRLPDDLPMPSSIDVVLTPSESVARQTIEITSFVGDELVIRNVAVEGQRVPQGPQPQKGQTP